jgi:hypothetical protein
MHELQRRRLKQWRTTVLALVARRGRAVAALQLWAASRSCSTSTRRLLVASYLARWRDELHLRHPRPRPPCAVAVPDDVTTPSAGKVPAGAITASSPPPPPAADAARAPAAKKDKRRAQWKRRRDRAAKLSDAADAAAEDLDHSMDPISYTQQEAAETPAKEAQTASSELHLRERLEATGEDGASLPSPDSSAPIGIESSPPTPRGHARSSDIIALSRTSSSRGGFGESDGDASSGHLVWADVEAEEAEVAEAAEAAEAAEQETVGRRVAVVPRTQDALLAAANHSGGGAVATKRTSRRQRKAAAAAEAAEAAATAAALEAEAATSETVEAVRQQEEEAARDVAVERPSPLEPCTPVAAAPEPSSCVVRVASSGRYDDAGAGAALLALLQAGTTQEEASDAQVDAEEEAGVDPAANYVVQRSQSAYAASIDSPSPRREEVFTGGFDAEAARRFLAERTCPRLPTA